MVILVYIGNINLQSQYKACVYSYFWLGLVPDPFFWLYLVSYLAFYHHYTQWGVEGGPASFKQSRPAVL